MWEHREACLWCQASQYLTMALTVHTVWQHGMLHGLDVSSSGRSDTVGKSSPNGCHAAVPCSLETVLCCRHHVSRLLALSRHAAVIIMFACFLRTLRPISLLPASVVLVICIIALEHWIVHWCRRPMSHIACCLRAWLVSKHLHVQLQLSALFPGCSRNSVPVPRAARYSCSAHVRHR